MTDLIKYHSNGNPKGGEESSFPAPSRYRKWIACAGASLASILLHTIILATFATITVFVTYRFTREAAPIQQVLNIKDGRNYYIITRGEVLPNPRPIRPPGKCGEPSIWNLKASTSNNKERVKANPRPQLGQKSAADISSENTESTNQLDSPSKNSVSFYKTTSGNGRTYNSNGRGGESDMDREKTDNAVQAALKWLHFHQDIDGKWDVDNFQKNCARGKCHGHGKGHSFDPGVTGLALLAYLGNGHTHRLGEFRKTVRKSLRYLKKIQNAEGCFGKQQGESWFYNHAICLGAISEAYAMTRDRQMDKMARSALKFGLAAKNPGLGWKYEPKGGKNDTSVTTWMVLALHAAKTAGLEVPDQAFKNARKWYDKVTASNGRTGYERPFSCGFGSGRLGKKFVRQETMTGMAIMGRIFAGGDKNSKVIQKGAKLLMNKLPKYDKPSFKKVNYYHWHFATNAMFQVGGDSWKKWNRAMKKALLDSQRAGGCEDGSWDSVGEWCIVGGRVYATAINALTLEVNYRYDRLQEDAGSK